MIKRFGEFWSHAECKQYKALRKRAVNQLHERPEGATAVEIVDGVRHSYTVYTK